MENRISLRGRFWSHCEKQKSEQYDFRVHTFHQTGYRPALGLKPDHFSKNHAKPMNLYTASTIIIPILQMIKLTQKLCNLPKMTEWQAGILTVGKWEGSRWGNR